MNAKIAAFLKDGKTGGIFLYVNEGRVESFEFKEHGRVSPESAPHTYSSAFVPLP